MNSNQSVRSNASSDSQQPKVGRLSSAVRRQRAGPENTGAFGQRTGHSDLYFLEGILPTNDDGVCSDDPIDVQTERCLDRLEEVLATHDLGFEHLMRVRVMLTDLESRDVVDHRYAERFDGEYPPRTTTGVSELPSGAAIQLEVVAADE